MINTQAVTVEDAYEQELWKAGTLKRGVYHIVSIDENADTTFNLRTKLGNTLYKFCDDWLDYTPAQPVPKRRYPAMPRRRRFLALTSAAGVNVSRRALERSQRENAELRAALNNLLNALFSEVKLHE